MNSQEYTLKATNEDFEVTEVPLLPRFQEKGAFTYLWMKKSGFSTFDAQDALKAFFKLSHSDVAAEGLKDEDGVTSQIISVRMALKESRLKAFNKKHTGSQSYIILERIMGYGDVHVAEKLLHGNSFNIVVRDLDEEAASKVVAYCADNKFISFVNYYDSQRFGMPGGPYNTHLIGKAIIEQDWKEAYSQLVLSKNEAPTPQGDDFKSVFSSLNPKKVDFFVSSYDSFHWNLDLSGELQRTCAGTLCAFKDVSDLFLPAGNTFSSKSMMTNHGHKIEASLNVVKKPNTRCALISTAVYVLETGDDEMNPGRKKIRLAFFLPTGCYATMCVRQLIQKAMADSR